MGKEIVINAEKDQTRIAILEDGDLAELYFETPENERTIGDIYLGRIRRVMPSIQAAFVDIGQEQDAFLHFSDLPDNLTDWLAYVNQDRPQAKTFKPKNSRRSKRHHPKRGSNKNRSKSGKQRTRDARQRGKRRSAQRRSKNQRGRGRSIRSRAAKILKRDQRVLVKVTKEPISNKGSRISADISLAGRFLVLVPLANYAAVSKKITSQKERRRLKALARSLLPQGFGVIVRTVAEGRDAKTLDTDLRLLMEKWQGIEKKLAGRPGKPLKVYEDVNMASSIIRDLFSEDYDRILIDNPRMYRSVRNYIHAVAPQMEKAVQLHKGDDSVFQRTNLKQDIEEVFDHRVELPSGGYLFIERTEAMHVVDVNSGRSGRGMSQEENSLKVNLEAARAIAKQIRLRDLGGIIVVDFIDLRHDHNRKKVYDELKKEFKSDRAVTKVLPMSDFGLVQITRQRLRPSITTTFSGPDAGNGETVEEKGDTRRDARKQQKAQQRERQKRAQQQREQQQREQQQQRRKKQEEARKREERRSRQEQASTPQEQQHASANGRSSEKQAAGPAPAPKQSPSELLDELDAWVEAYKGTGGRAVTLHVHPFTAAYLNRRVPTQPTRWFMKHLVRVRVEPDPAMRPLDYRFTDPRNGDDVTDRVRRQGQQRARS
jgi:ribonuclease G